MPIVVIGISYYSGRLTGPRLIFRRAVIFAFNRRVKRSYLAIRALTLSSTRLLFESCILTPRLKY